ncbi:polyprenyl synthetase family protein [Glutamicibacter sp. AOP5-A2-18]|uniref:polyprenyl synthetase family protein n=1 Tax=Glutamicibacter sp. AOP5-A2-18 TaxID=3457656 RepID=UPI0040331D88
MTTHASTDQSSPAGPRTMTGEKGFIDEVTRAAISDRLEQIGLQAQQRSAAYSAQAAVLWSQITARLSTGKLMRPALVMLGYRAFSGCNEVRAIDLGCAFELLHSALLIHDDVVDKDFVRRAEPTISALYRDQALTVGRSQAEAEHAGNSVGIIAGDLLISEAIKLAARAAAGTDSESVVEQAFFQAIEQAGAGELEDLLYSLGSAPATTSEVLRMEQLKTASYSFQLPLQAGALLAGATMGQAENIGTVGCQLGVAYQVIDDVLGTFGDPSCTGKSVESDLREFKSTILLALAAEQPEFAQMLNGLRSGHVSVGQIRQELVDQGTEQFARHLAQALCSRATGSTAFRDLPEQAQQLLRTCSHLILERRR